MKPIDAPRGGPLARKKLVVECPNCVRYLIDAEVATRGAIPADVARHLAENVRSSHGLADSDHPPLPEVTEWRVEALKMRIAPLAIARGRFVEALLHQREGDEMAMAMNTLLADGRDDWRLATGPTSWQLAKEEPKSRTKYPPSGGFVTELIDALALCWWAYRMWANKASPWGVSKKTLTQLPGKLEKLADTLDKVNRSVYGNPARMWRELADWASRATSSKWPGAAKQFGALASFEATPSFMRRYAEELRHLQSRSGPAPPIVPMDAESLPLSLVESTTGKPHLPSRSGLGHHNVATDAEALLLHLVEKTSGGPQLQKVGALLEAAFSLAQPPRDRSRAFDEAALGRRYARFKAAKKRPGRIGKGSAVLLVNFLSRRTTRSK